MPIVNPTPSAPPAQTPNIVEITKPAYRGVTVDTSYVPQSALLTAIEGSSMTVNYYSQVVDDDNDLSGQQVSRDPTNQQYRLINRLEIKLQNSLTTTQDQQTKQLHVNGTAVCYPFMVPQEGDMFLADLDDGREGIFRVNNSERRTYLKESCYQIDFVLVDYSTPARRGDLTRKVIQEYYFLRDFLMHGQNPLLLPQDYADVQELTRRYFELLDIYMRSFMSPEFKTLVLPSQPRPVYDHFLVKAVAAAFNTWDCPQLAEMSILNVDGIDAMGCFTIWDALLRRDDKLRAFMNKKAGLLSTGYFSGQPMFEAIRFSGISYAVYPADDEVSVNYEVRPRGPCPSDSAVLCEGSARPGVLQDLIGTTVLAGLPYSKAPLIHDVTVDDYYIFSQAFYQKLPEGQSQLELLVRDYLEGKAINRRTLVLLTNCWQGFSSLSRFYYLPIILMMVRAAIRTI